MCIEVLRDLWYLEQGSEESHTASATQREKRGGLREPNSTNYKHWQFLLWDAVSAQATYRTSRCRMSIYLSLCLGLVTFFEGASGRHRSTQVTEVHSPTVDLSHISAWDFPTARHLVRRGPTTTSGGDDRDRQGERERERREGERERERDGQFMIGCVCAGSCLAFRNALDLNNCLTTQATHKSLSWSPPFLVCEKAGSEAKPGYNNLERWCSSDG